MSERLNVTFRESLPPSVVNELDFWSARLNANQTEVNQRLSTAGFGVYNVVDYGALADGETDDYDAIMAAYEAMPTHQYGGKTGILYFPPGIYKHSKTLNFYGSNFRVVGGNDAILYYTGSSVCVSFDGTGASYTFGGGMEHIHIRGNVNATTGLYVNNLSLIHI